MKRSAKALFIATLTICNLQFATAQVKGREVPFTLDDRDRLIQIEEKLNSQQKQITDLKENLQKQIDTRFEATDTRFDAMQDKFNWGFGIMMSLMLFLLGFIIWDRRTTLDPIRQHTQSLIQTLREYAKEQPKLADILRSYGLM